MSRHLYHTNAIILGSTPVKEADRFFQLLTKDLGLINASAQGVRHMKSKLRYSLQEYQPAQVTLVRGKEVWRITNAVALSWNFPKECQKEAQRAFARIAALVRRMLHGEESIPEVYEEAHKFGAFLESGNYEYDDIGLAEYLAGLRILAYLGYVAPTSSFSELVASEEYAPLLPKVKEHKRAVVETINVALKASHL